MMRTEMRIFLSSRRAHYSRAAGSAVCAPEGPGGQRAAHPEAVLRSSVEQGLNATPTGAGSKRSARTLPRVEGPLALSGEQLSNTTLFELLDA